MVDFDSLPDESAAPIAALTAVPQASQGAPAEGTPASFDTMQDDEEKYGTPGQMAITGLEGAAHGVAGPLATMTETALGVPKEDILLRQKTNPITHGIGQGVGLVGGMMAGTGEAALVAKAGEAAAGLAGIGEATQLARVGSQVVAQAAEMAVLQGSDEVSKMILQDPDTSAQTAMANVGMSAALGGAGGAVMEGAISPLWKATAGPKIDQALNSLKSHLNGTSKLEIPEAVLNAEKELGIQLPPALRSAMSGNPRAMQLFNELREAQHPEVTAMIKGLQENSHKAVLDALHVPLEEVAHYSENDAGHGLMEAFAKEYDAKYAPVAQALAERDALAHNIAVPDEARLQRMGEILEAGMKSVGTDSPYYKLYQHYGDRLLAKDTIGGMDQLKTELFKRAKNIAADQNEKDALHQIRNMINDFQEKQIAQSGVKLGLESNGINEAGVKALQREVSEGPADTRLWAARDAAEEAQAKAISEGKQLGAEVINQRADANRNYAEFSKMSQELTEHLGAGDFKGQGTLKAKLGNKVAPEDLLKKFSPKGNADIIPFLEKHFPETLAEVQKNESRRFLKPHVGTEQGEHVLNVNKLSKAVEKGMAGSPELTNFAMPGDSLKKLQAAKVLQDAIPDMKSSGTAGWMSKLTKHVPASAMSMLAMLMGHNPIAGYVLGEVGQRMGKDAPEAIKLGMLNFLSADKPVKAEAFKSAVDYMHNVVQGEKLINKSVNNVFQIGAKSIPHATVDAAQRIKLDKLVAERQDHPNEQMQAASEGHLGHYLPTHQVAATQSSTAALQYLQAIKPKPYQSSPLDRKIEPSDAQNARYNRALDIAQSPASVMQHVKDGTLQASDVQDLNAMYPALYKQMVQKISNAMISHTADEEPIPYHTRVGLSIFLGQPLDSSMAPSSIMAAQPKLAPPPQQPGDPKAKPAKLKEKSADRYQTPGQNAEADRSKRH